MKYLGILLILILFTSFTFAANSTVVDFTKEFNSKLIKQIEADFEKSQAAAEYEKNIADIIAAYTKEDSDTTYTIDTIINSDLVSSLNNTYYSDTPGASALEKRVHELVNDYREQNSLQKLSWDEDLASIARNYSETLSRMGYLSHTGPRGGNFSTRYAQAGYNCSIQTTSGYTYFGGENLFYISYFGGDNQTAYETVDSWMNSPGHRSNILSGIWGREGIGAYISENGKVYVTQNFC